MIGHQTMEPAERIQLLREHLRDAIEPTWAEPFHDAWMAHEHEADPVRLARAQAAELAAANPVIKPGELIIGNNSLQPVVSAFTIAFSSGIRLDEERLEQVIKQHPEARERAETIADYWRKWFRENDYHSPMAMHATLAYERVLDKGITGLRRYVEHHKQANEGKPGSGADWYEALLITLDGISAFIDRHADAAESQAGAETCPQRREELSRIAQSCRHISQRPPRTFFEAVQLFYLTFWLAGHDSPGPIDRYLYPALKRDLDSGWTTLDQAQELVDCLWLKFEEKTAYGATLAGQLPDGSDACNELTHLCLQSVKRLRILSPRTAFRWHPEISQDHFREGIDVIATGASYPALLNDEAFIAGMVDRGIALEHARDYSFVGCGQTYPHGRGHGSYEDVIVNSAKPLELALNNGIDPVSGQRAGLETGDVEQFTTFAEFETAYQAQVDHHITERIDGVNAHRERNRRRWWTFLRSMISYSCIERGLDWHAGGADYSEGMVDMVGLTTVTDSLLAIRQGVFEEGKVTLSQLRDALAANWEGHEDLRRYFLARLPKFGNDSEEADRYTGAEVERINRHIRSHRTVFGGPWGLDIIGWSGAASCGAETGATPDGRLAGTPLADCAGPAQGRNVKGVTATLNSMFHLPHSSAHGPLVLSLRFPESAVSGSAGRDRLKALTETYFNGGGQQLQISIAGTRQMKQALADPESHRDLMVRVGGFSAYFVELDRVFQEDMIARSEMDL